MKINDIVRFRISEDFNYGNLTGEIALNKKIQDTLNIEPPILKKISESIFECSKDDFYKKVAPTLEINVDSVSTYYCKD